MGRSSGALLEPGRQPEFGSIILTWEIRNALMCHRDDGFTPHFFFCWFWFLQPLQGAVRDGFVEGQPGQAKEMRWWLVLHFRGLFPQGSAWCFAERVGFAACPHGALSLVPSGLCLVLVGPQTQGCYPVAVSLSNTCIWKDPSNLSALILAQMKQKEI